MSFSREGFQYDRGFLGGLGDSTESIINIVISKLNLTLKIELIINRKGVATGLLLQNFHMCATLKVFPQMPTKAFSFLGKALFVHTQLTNIPLSDLTCMNKYFQLDYVAN